MNATAQMYDLPAQHIIRDCAQSAYQRGEAEGRRQVRRDVEAVMLDMSRANELVGLDAAEALRRLWARL